MQPDGKPELRALLENQIRRDGPLRFDHFMRLCLYAPEWGYYERPDTLPGRGGDFMTSVSVGPVFGELLADYAHHAWTALGHPASWTLCEQGSHHGHLAADLLNRLQSRWPEAYEGVQLHLIEPSETRQGIQAATLAGHGSKVGWLSDEASLKSRSWQGLFYSNELPDSFPVRRFIFEAGAWQEFHVDLQNRNFTWTTQELHDTEALEALKHWTVPKTEGYIAEWSPAQAPWMRRIAQSLEAGAVLTIDYGWPAEELYCPERSQGSLTSFYRNRKETAPLSRPGEQDLTAQVNFTALEEAGIQAGLETLEFTDQHRFLTRLASLAFLSEAETAGAAAAGRIRQFATLIRPELMGASFKALLQVRNPQGNLEAFRI